MKNDKETTEIVKISWKITTIDSNDCPSPYNTGNIASYVVKDIHNNWVTLGCAEYGIPKNRSNPWIFPPSNDYLAQYEATSDLYFTD